MKTYTIPHAHGARTDEALMSRLRSLTLPVEEGAGILRIGIAAEDGRLYRVIETSSIVEAVRVHEALAEAGLEPHERLHRVGRRPMKVYEWPRAVSAGSSHAAPAHAALPG